MTPQVGSRLFLDSAILFVSPPLLPRVRGMACHDRVGQKSQAFVSGCPISICIPGGRDEVLHRWSSTKDGTLCPVSYSSALDHLLSILESNEIKDHGRLVTVGAVQDTDRYSTKGCRYGTIETWVRCGWSMCTVR